MNPSKPDPMPEPTCRECGATNEPGATECWLCQRRDWQSAEPATKASVRQRDDPTRRRIAIAIVASVVVILGSGMLLDILGRPNLEGPLLLIPTLAIPVILIVWAHFQRRLPRGPSMTNRELAAAGSTIAASAILLTWFFTTAAGSADSLAYAATMLGILAVPAAAITWWRAWRRHQQGRPMTALQLIASFAFLTVLLPPLLLLSLAIALWLVCVATGQMGPNMH